MKQRCEGTAEELLQDGGAFRFYIPDQPGTFL